MAALETIADAETCADEMTLKEGGVWFGSECLTADAATRGVTPVECCRK